MRGALLSDFWFLEFNVVKKLTMNLFKDGEDFGFSDFCFLE